MMRLLMSRVRLKRRFRELPFFLFSGAVRERWKKVFLVVCNIMEKERAWGVGEKL